MSKYISLTGAENIRIVPSGQSLQAEALQKTKQITTVNDAHSQAKAIGAVAIAKGLLKGVEQSRKEVKAPLLELGKELDRVATEYCQPICMEVNRIELLIAGFQEAEAKRVEEEKQAQLQRQAEEMREKLRLEEAQRQAALQAENARTKKQREAAQKAAEELAIQQAELEIQAGETASNEMIETAKAEGAAVRKTFDFEVTDIAALYASYPQCVKMEVKKQAVRDVIEVLQRQGKSLEIPGVKLTEITKVAVRSVPASLTLGN